MDPWTDIDASFANFEAKRRLTECLDASTSSDTLQEWVLNALQSNQVFLNMLHVVFKRDRKEHTGHGVLIMTTLVSQPTLRSWMESSLALKEERRVVPFLVCMIDIVKATDHPSRNGVLDHLEAQTKQVCQLWCHQHITVVRRSMELVWRLVPYLRESDSRHVVLSNVLQWATMWLQKLSSSSLYELLSEERTEFYHDNTACVSPFVIDRECLKMSISIFIMATQDPRTVLDARSLLDDVASRCKDVASTEVLDIVFGLFGNNDDDMVRFQADILELYQQPQSESLQRLLTGLCITPHTLFVYMLNWTGFDHAILVDLLMSVETDFLSFLVKYLRFILQDPLPLVEVLRQQEDLDNVIYLFRRLISILCAGGFPYNPAALVRRLEGVVEQLQKVPQDASSCA